MPQPKVVVEEDPQDTTPKPVVKKVSLTILKGTVTDAKTGEPVESAIKVIDNEKNLVISEFRSNSVTGKYLVSLPSADSYLLGALPRSRLRASGCLGGSSLRDCHRWSFHRSYGPRPGTRSEGIVDSRHAGRTLGNTRAADFTISADLV